MLPRIRTTPSDRKLSWAIKKCKWSKEHLWSITQTPRRAFYNKCSTNKNRTKLVSNILKVVFCKSSMKTASSLRVCDQRESTRPSWIRAPWKTSSLTTSSRRQRNPLRSSLRQVRTAAPQSNSKWLRTLGTRVPTGTTSCNYRQRNPHQAELTINCTNKWW